MQNRDKYKAKDSQNSILNSFFERFKKIFSKNNYGDKKRKKTNDDDDQNPNIYPLW
tara:strand:- start:506 stop:673 length:168 start_codon:yes stop_codon:yes gene_type:complete